MRNPNKRPCQALSKSGQPCKSYAIPGHDYCRSHVPFQPPPNPTGAAPGNQNARRHGAYSEFITEADLVALASGADSTLEDEIAFTRAVVRRLADRMINDPDLTPEDHRNISDALFRGTGRVAQLLKTNRSLSGQAADGLAGALSRALDELGAELGIEL